MQPYCINLTAESSTLQKNKTLPPLEYSHKNIAQIKGQTFILRKYKNRFHFAFFKNQQQQQKIALNIFPLSLFAKRFFPIVALLRKGNGMLAFCSGIASFLGSGILGLLLDVECCRTLCEESPFYEMFIDVLCFLY